MQEIRLTPQELEDLKDDIKFKVKTTLVLKNLCVKIDALNGVPLKVVRLESKVGLLIWLIPIILVICSLVITINGR